MLHNIIELYPDETFLIADGFDSAVIGIEQSEMRLIYSISKMIEILSYDMSEFDAIEHIEYNVTSAYVGEKTPIWCYDNF